MQRHSFSKYCFKISLSLLIGIAPNGFVQAHGDSHEMLKAVTEELRERPRDPDLYFRRGELHRRHGDWDLALIDYETAGKYSTNAPMVDLARGLLFVEAQWPQSAKFYLDRFLSREPKNVVGLTARAKLNLLLDDREAAIRDYNSAIRVTTDPRPDLFIERAQALITDDGGRLQEAIDGLDEGIRRLGSLVNLQLYAIDLELKRKQTNAALARLDKVITQSPRKETWLARRGEILQNAGRWQESRTAYLTALEQLGTLPPARRNVPAILELEKRIRGALAEVEKKGAH